jgi:hypothetical protein
LAILLLLVAYMYAIEYIGSENRYDIYEDFGPVFSVWCTPLAFVLFYAWPVAIGSTVYLSSIVVSIHSFPPLFGTVTISPSHGHLRVLQAQT